MERFDSPPVAALIPTFNRSQSLPRALNSLERQSLKIFEVVVVDDGSSDDTEQVVKTFKPRLCLGSLKIRPSGGRTRPNRKGVPEAEDRTSPFSVQTITATETSLRNPSA